MDTVISTSALVKRYGRTRALDGLDLEVAEGEVHGFLGPNGAGKSTTIRVLLGLARATSGTATVFGADPWRDVKAIHPRLGYVPGDVSVWPSLSGGEAIDLLARLRGSGRDRAEYERRKSGLIEEFEFDPRKRGRSYSKGNRQKVALIAAFAVRADLLVLDEPTSGLDPLMETVFARQIAAAADEGTTVLLSSHILSEVERLCHRVSIIRAGRLVESGTLEQLRHLTRTEVAFSDRGVERGTLERIPGAHDLAVDAGRVRFTVDSADLPAVLGALADLRPSGLTVAPPSLEELFLRHYGDRHDGDRVEAQS